jgi:Recombination endonuclease VII
MVFSDEEKLKKKAYNKEYKLKNKERLKQYQAEYRKANRDKVNQRMMIWKKKNKDINKDKKKRNKKNSKLKYKYGITINDFDAMFVKQNKCCAICLKDLSDSALMERYTHVDHCHRTGVVRGILCTGCNFTLGHCKDSVVILENCIKYLENGEKIYLDKISLADFHDNTEAPEQDFAEAPEWET